MKRDWLCEWHVRIEEWVFVLMAKRRRRVGEVGPVVFWTLSRFSHGWGPPLSNVNYRCALGFTFKIYQTFFLNEGFIKISSCWSTWRNPGSGLVKWSIATQHTNLQRRPAPLWAHCTGFPAHFCTFGVNAHFIFDNSHLGYINGM
jgi:hypothetical protein